MCFLITVPSKLITENWAEMYRQRLHKLQWFQCLAHSSRRQDYLSNEDGEMLGSRQAKSLITSGQTPWGEVLWRLPRIPRSDVVRCHESFAMGRKRSDLHRAVADCQGAATIASPP